MGVPARELRQQLVGISDDYLLTRTEVAALLRCDPRRLEDALRVCPTFGPHRLYRWGDARNAMYHPPEEAPAPAANGRGKVVQHPGRRRRGSRGRPPSV